MKGDYFPRPFSIPCFPLRRCFLSCRAIWCTNIALAQLLQEVVCLEKVKSLYCNRAQESPIGIYARNHSICCYTADIIKTTAAFIIQTHWIVAFILGGLLGGKDDFSVCLQSRISPMTNLAAYCHLLLSGPWVLLWAQPVPGYPYLTGIHASRVHGILFPEPDLHQSLSTYTSGLDTQTLTMRDKETEVVKTLTHAKQ